MPDEKNYEAHLLTIEDALSKLGNTSSALIMAKAYELWEQTKDAARYIHTAREESWDQPEAYAGAT